MATTGLAARAENHVSRPLAQAIAPGKLPNVIAIVVLYAEVRRLAVLNRRIETAHITATSR